MKDTCPIINLALDDFYKFWETADETLLEKIVSKDVKDHDKDPRNTGSDYQGLLDLANAVQGLTEMKHNLVQIHKLENQMCVVRWEASAKHTGNFFGIPATGKTVFFAGHDIMKFENGKITELWHIEQLLQLMGQIQ